MSSNVLADSASLQEEIRQLKRTLEIRRSEIALTQKRVTDLEHLSSAMRETSLACNEKVRLLNQLEQDLHQEVDRGASLQRELVHLQRSIAAEDAARTRSRQQQIQFITEALKIANDMLQISHHAQASDPLPPRKTIASLTSISEEIVDFFVKSTSEFETTESNIRAEQKRLQQVHLECVRAIEIAAENNAHQRDELDEAWQMEEQQLAKQLQGVKQRAREAAFHHHRGSGVKYEGSLEERKSIAERRVVHQECVELERAIHLAEEERGREKIANIRAREALLGRPLV